MISADVKANKNNKKDLVTVSYLEIFIKKYLQNLKYNARACIFHFILISIVSIVILSVKNRGWGKGGRGGGLLNEQNLLSVTKVICRQSLKQ